MIWLTKFVIRTLELAGRTLPSQTPKHLLTGKQGEIEAYLYLRTLGYKIVATNFRVPYDRGEIDLIGWDDGVLCFIEVKTRTRSRFALRLRPQSTWTRRSTFVRSPAAMFADCQATGPAMPLRYRQRDSRGRRP